MGEKLLELSNISINKYVVGKSIELPNAHLFNALKHIEVNYGCVDYPVGAYLIDNLPIINSMLSSIKEHSKGFCINLWCTGSSGAIIAALMAKELILCGRCVYISHVKKENEDAHSTFPSYDKTYFNVAVDDFIDSGATVERLSKAILKHKLSCDLLCVSGTIYLNNDRIRQAIEPFNKVIASRFKTSND